MSAVPSHTKGGTGLAGLAGHVAIVTGGGRGLGHDIARTLHTAGADVVVCGREGEVLTASAREIDPSGESVVPMVCDIRDERAVSALVPGVLQRFGRIDALVNNSGIAGPTSRLWESSLAEWQDTLDTNVTGTFLCCRAVLPSMIEQRSGAVVTIGSAGGKRPNSGRAAYAASKTALIGLTRTLAVEAGPFGIRVNLVTPGAINSERFQKVIDQLAVGRGVPRAEVLREAVSGSPLGRLVEPSHVADVVAFLLGDGAASITGEDINVSAGLVMY
ncbi:SDR family NAD(P)-dependent oxidoreductase [Streptomyces sp. NPDC002018]|uniref:SDR family NAD(P)-dependent oxidoreductase n=1 Tax=Streptomyces sp. NPDC002018 TaxID=3364629 RepID=UPI0036C6F12F